MPAVKKRGAGGRPTKYKNEYCDRAFDFSLIGMTDGEIAGALKIDEATLYRWKNNYPDFCESIKRGRDRFDTEVVEQALRERAAGYNYQEEVMTRDGPSVITKRFHGSDTAAIFWLKNRQSGRWRDRVEHDVRQAVVNIEATPEEKARIIAAALSRGANAPDT
jgi:transposase-like protein